nr:hypothetical protein [Tanacetum cinerariifolium]
MNDKLNVIHRDIKSANILRFSLGRTKRRDIKNVVERNGVPEPEYPVLLLWKLCYIWDYGRGIEFQVLENEQK